MPAARRVPWLICYDIADPRRLGRVHKLVSRQAEPLQYSVYRVCATRKEAVHALNTVAAEIDSRADDLRAYPLLTAATPVIYGRSLTPSGVKLLYGRDALFNNL